MFIVGNSLLRVHCRPTDQTVRKFFAIVSREYARALHTCSNRFDVGLQSYPSLTREIRISALQSRYYVGRQRYIALRLESEIRRSSNIKSDSDFKRILSLRDLPSLQPVGVHEQAQCSESLKQLVNLSFKNQKDQRVRFADGCRQVPFKSQVARFMPSLMTRQSIETTEYLLRQ